MNDRYSSNFMSESSYAGVSHMLRYFKQIL